MRRLLWGFGRSRVAIGTINCSICSTQWRGNRDGNTRQFALARLLHTGQLAAVKALRPEVVAGTPNAIARFIREGEALRELDLHNTVKMIDAVEEDGRHYLVMEYVPGGSLRDLLEKQGRLPIERTVEIALEVAGALTRAHHLGIIHRDL
ncbi:MAG: protein kinase, partial [Anaerolineae bacterium]|nr:protein kinase [Anaerolineae bacterium]